MTLTLNYDEALLLDELLRRAHVKKLDAFETCAAAMPNRFTARDFGLPLIETLITKLENLQ